MRRYTLFCRRWRRANVQLSRLGAEAPSSVVTPYNPITADKILHYFRHLPDDQINQARCHYWYSVDTPRHELPPPDDNCIGIHLAFLLDCPPNVAHGIAFRVDFYEFGAWLQIDASQPNTKKYDIRRWLRENDMLDRYADDDDDDRVYWEIPADYQAPRLDPSL